MKTESIEGKVAPKAFYRTKKYQGFINHITLYRQRLPEENLGRLKADCSDILIEDGWTFFFRAFETRPVERRFGLREYFDSSMITRIDRKLGRISALRRWWHVQKMIGKKSCIDKNKPEIDLAGPGWEPLEIPDGSIWIEAATLPW